MPFLISLPLREPRLPDESRRDSKPEGLSEPWAHVLLWGGLLAVLLIIFVIRTLTAEQRAIDKMEPQARGELYRETWQGFHTLCEDQHDSALTERCRQQALFLLKFPECDEACRQKLDAFTRPSR